MAEFFRMPEISTDADSATIAEWVLAEGASFEPDDVVVVVETDKATVDVEAGSRGVILRTLVSAGQAVANGTPIAVFGTATETAADADTLLATSAPADPADISSDADNPDTLPEISRSAATAPATLTAVDATPSRIFISPLARRLAAEAGLEPAGISGTGPGGRIRAADVDAARVALQVVPDEPAPLAAPEPAPAPIPARAEQSEFVDTPHSRFRRTVASRLTSSKRDQPHFYVEGSASVDALLALRTDLAAQGGVKVSVNDLLVGAVARAHVAVPEMNVIWTPDAVRSFGQVDISIAVSTDKGLLTPVLRGVETMSVSTISRLTRALIDQANSGTLRQADLEGGTITISNLGMYNVKKFTAIINPPQSSILAVGAATSEAVVVDGAVTVATMLNLVLSVDHRPVDGVVAARWMQALIELIENPLRILA
jgi:pyruvate dehydrogenase E2 component (dihydrolipoamide acetyltransferase)